MTTRIVVICEDHTLDQYVAKPVFERMLAHLGKPHAQVKVVDRPRLQGISSVKRNLCDIVARWCSLADAIIVAVDLDREDGLDGRPNRRASLQSLIDNCTPTCEKVLLVLAQHEMEVWALWGSRSEIEDAWATVRAERDPKEAYFDPLLSDSDLQSPGSGRTRLITKSLAAGWPSIAQGCPELATLATEVEALLAT